MADPTIQTFCCHHRQDDNSVYYLMTEFSKESFLIISIISSLIGISGSVYQIFIRKNTEEVSTPRSLTGRKIIIYLAYSDLFASFCVLVRSGTWGFFKQTMPYDDDTVSVLFCSITSAFVQLFYTATWIWTFLYAYNMKCALKNQNIQLRNLHFIVWSLSILLTAIGTTSLYYPDADCHNYSDISTALLHKLPNYLVNHVPILFVMIANPIIYVQCSREVDKQLIQRYGQYTNNERQVHDLFKIKFSLINIIFYVCWLPNILNAIFIWSMWSRLLRDPFAKIVVFNWYIIAVLNPLQAFFNAFVYRKWNEKLYGCCWIKNCMSRWCESRRNYTTQVITESTPLLQSSSSQNADEIDRINLETQQDDPKFYKFSIQCPLV